MVVITTGWNAYAHTGSSGDGYSFSKKLGHSITELGPSLSSFEVAEAFPKSLSGISLPKAQLKWNSELLTEGPILFTHFGISGPGPFAFSSLLAFKKIDKANSLQISLAPMAWWWVQEWDRYIEQEAKTHSNREVRNMLELLPRRLVEAMGASRIIPVKILNQKWATLSKEDRRTISKVLGDGIPLTITARRAGDEFVTAGGVDCTEVDTESLESKIKTGIFFAGEVLNIDGVTWWFNLQAAWSTGNLAWRSIVERLKILK
jgi:predicted Rossmann fold flavoprotein